jgi:hypothetical protein
MCVCVCMLEITSVLLRVRTCVFVCILSGSWQRVRSQGAGGHPVFKQYERFGCLCKEEDRREEQRSQDS